jgi:hypothetical protein
MWVNLADCATDALSDRYRWMIAIIESAEYQLKASRC